MYSKTVIVFHFYPVLQYDELEGLGFVGFALAFFEDKSEIVGTSSTLKCFTPELVEYLHAVMIAGWFVCLATVTQCIRALLVAIELFCY